jgi:hypothetical protein
MGRAGQDIVRDHPGPEECARRLVETLTDAARRRATGGFRSPRFARLRRPGAAAGADVRVGP